MAIAPDTKNWTWVLDRRCDECGFDAGTFPAERTGAAVRQNAKEWRALLMLPNASRRSHDDRWSTLEYACHVRDVFRIFSQRLDLMLTTDGPRYENWDQDEAARRDAYGDQTPERVADEIDEIALALADLFDSVSGVQWHRTGSRTDGAEFTVESFARYFIHDPIHHLWDVTG